MFTLEKLSLCQVKAVVVNVFFDWSEGFDIDNGVFLPYPLSKKYLISKIDKVMISESKGELWRMLHPNVKKELQERCEQSNSYEDFFGGITNLKTNNK